MASSNDQYEVPGMEERITGSKAAVTINKTRMDKLEKALFPYEKRLRRHERFRRILGGEESTGPPIRGTSRVQSSGLKEPDGLSVHAAGKPPRGGAAKKIQGADRV